MRERGGGAEGVHRADPFTAALQRVPQLRRPPADSGIEGQDLDDREELRVWGLPAPRVL